MFVVTNGLLSPFLVTEGYASFFDGETSMGTLSLSVENCVSISDKYVPLTGVHATETEINGWVYDRRRVEDWDTLRTRYNTFLGGHRDGLKDGLPLEAFQSGSIANLSYHDTVQYRNQNFLTWTPRVVTGAYSLYWCERNLYSDYSYSENVDIGQDLIGVSTMRLRDDAAYQTIEAAIWERRSDFSIFKLKNFDYVEEFTGELDLGSNSRLETESADVFIPANFASRKNETTIRDSILYFNQDTQLKVGINEPALDLGFVPAALIENIWESKGTGAATGRDLFTRFFPLQKNSVTVVDVISETIGTWVEVETLNFSGPTDRHYVVDYDLGIVTIGGYKAENLILSKALSESDTEIEVFSTSALNQYPDQGILIVGGEQILYYTKTGSGFSDCIRGYNSTTPEAFSRGQTVEDIQHGLGSEGAFYLSYIAVPRVNYEVTPYIYRSANKSDWLDLKPVQNVETNNVLQILSSQLNLEEIILETDAPPLGGNLFGPVYYGTDVSKFTARALDASGSPVEGITLTIEIVEGEGSFNGSNASYSSLTNTLGEIYSFYNAPYTNDAVELIVTDVTHDGADTVMEVPQLQTGSDLQDIWVFQILKHDEALGSIGLLREVVVENLATVMPHGDTSLEIDGFVDKEDYKDGWIYIIGTDSVKRYRKILNVWDSTDGSGRPISVLGLDEALPSGTSVGQSIRLYKSDEKEWNSSLLNGSRVILYEFSNEVQHPLTGEVGAYAPIHPNSITSNTLTFEARNLALPAPEDDTLNLGGYAVIAPSEVLVQAYGTDPASGRIIRSNQIKLALNLPGFLRGVDRSGELPIPTGWTLVSEEFNIGTALGGANFITINPAANNINQFSLTGVL